MKINIEILELVKVTKTIVVPLAIIFISKSIKDVAMHYIDMIKARNDNNAYVEVETACVGDAAYINNVACIENTNTDNIYNSKLYRDAITEKPKN